MERDWDIGLLKYALKEAIARRFAAGDTIDDLALDYRMHAEAIQKVIRWWIHLYDKTIKKKKEE